MTNTELYHPKKENILDLRSYMLEELGLKVNLWYCKEALKETFGDIYKAAEILLSKEVK